jgi:two-component system sensor histidine kinase MprB
MPRGAVQTARSLAENERLLAALRDQIVLAVVAVVAVAAGLAWLVARQVTLRLVRLTGAAEAVARTGRLDVDVPITGKDEAGRLGAAFSAMLGALARSREDQQRLVQDAGHELRTPLTSLRTNLAVLRRADRLTPAQRQDLLDDLDGEARELTGLVNELVELATDRREDEPLQPVSLAAVADRVADRARRRHGREVHVSSDASLVLGRPGALERAVHNLVDNAVKFDAGGSAPIEVVVSAGRVEVRDRGPGIAALDRPRVFDRFYRAIDARSRPGSGLGLSIVRAVAEDHGGTVFVAPRDGGGTVIGMQLPTVAPR